MPITAIFVALFMFILVITRYVIVSRSRKPSEKLPLSDDIQKTYYDKYEQETKQ
ncbi:MAG: hypothetical protein MR283_01945 [Erysipelotrichaceae bacterium]|nr:hypothetical protein [Erysipelotrichaceae bacterium]MDY6035270.1 hypothetical protein [Bulleidia sp.]